MESIDVFIMSIGTDNNSKMTCYLIANGLETPVKSIGNHLESVISVLDNRF